MTYARRSSHYPHEGALEDLVDELLVGDPLSDRTIPTGINDLDDLLGGGLRRGQVTLVAGGTGVGTTTFALNLAAHAALRAGTPAVVVAPESDLRELTVRVVSAETKVPVNHVRGGSMNADDRERVRRKREVLVGAPITFSAGHPDRTDVSTIVTQLESGLEGRRGLAVVDSTSFTEPDTRVLALELKALAQRADLAVVLVTRTEAPPSRLGQPPRLADVRDHGELVDLMDLVLLLHREDVHDIESLRPGEADIEIAKHRYGPTRTLTVAFQGHYARFVSMRHD